MMINATPIKQLITKERRLGWYIAGISFAVGILIGLAI